MMKRKAYDGYKSFQYLEPGVDYKAYDLTKEVDRVPHYKVPVTPEQEKEAEEILDTEIVVSAHEHIMVIPDDVSLLLDYNHTGRCPTGYEGMSVSRLDVVFENFLDGSAIITSHHGWKWTDVIHDLGIRFSDFAHQDLIFKAETYADLLRAKPEGKIALVACLEAATPIENELDRIDILYGFGVRLMGIAYSESNGLGSGLRETRDGGLTQFGAQAVKRMNKLGMTIDVSHCGDRTCLDTIERSEKPILITHTGAKALWNTSRMKPDEVFVACAEKGGVVGIEAAPHTTITRNNRVHSIDSVMEHFEYIANLVGIDHVTFGPDTSFGDHVGVHHYLSGMLSIQETHAGESFQEVEYVKGLENPAECFPNIVRWLVKHGYSREDIAKIIGKNVLRVLKETWTK